MGKHIQENNLKTINGNSLLGSGNIIIENSGEKNDRLVDIKTLDFGFGAIEETKSSRSMKVCSRDTEEADYVSALISKGVLKTNEYLMMPLLVSSKPVNSLKRVDGRSIPPLKVIHTIEMSVKDSFFVNSVGRKESDTLILFKKEYDGSKLDEYSKVSTYTSNVCFLTGSILTGTFGEHNELSLSSNYIKDDNSIHMINYHKFGVAGEAIDNFRYLKKKTEDCEFRIDCYIEYIFEDTMDVNAKNLIWDSLIYPNVYMLKRQ